MLIWIWMAWCWWQGNQLSPKSQSNCIYSSLHGRSNILQLEGFLFSSGCSSTANRSWVLNLCLFFLYYFPSFSKNLCYEVRGTTPTLLPSLPSSKGQHQSRHCRSTHCWICGLPSAPGADVVPSWPTTFWFSAGVFSHFLWSVSYWI